MTAVSARDVDRAVATRGPDVNLLLFYGPDSGRVAERARAAARGAVADPSDPFQLIRIDGDRLAEEPARLTEEASTFGLFGGKRAIWVGPTSRAIAGAVSACLEVPLVDTTVVIEAGDLSKAAPLRAACEKSPRALALPCYADEGRALTDVIVETLKARGLSIEPEARDLLAENLGGDRLATRGELEKLALYTHGQAAVTVEDVEAVVSDVSSIGVDAAIDAAFGGDRPGLDAALVQLRQAGSSPVAVLALAIRHALELLKAVVKLGGSPDVEGAVRAWRGLNFRRQDAVKRQLRTLNETALEGCLRRLQDAALETRRRPALADAEASQALLWIATRARAGRGRVEA